MKISNKNALPMKEAYTIGEVASILKIDQHVIRFWSEKFSQYIKPIRKAGQRRSYSQKDLELLKNIKELLYTKGFSIKGVQLLLKDKKNFGIYMASGKGDNTKIDNIITKLESLSMLIENTMSEWVLLKPVSSNSRPMGEQK